MNDDEMLKMAKEGWSPPAALLDSSPRESCLTGAGRVLVVLAVAFFLGALAAGVGLQALSRRQAEDVRLPSAANAGHVGAAPLEVLEDLVLPRLRLHPRDLPDRRLQGVVVPTAGEQRPRRTTPEGRAGSALLQMRMHDAASSGCPMK